MEALFRSRASTAILAAEPACWFLAPLLVSCFGLIDFTHLDDDLLAQGCDAKAADHSLPTSPASRLVGCAVGEASCADKVKAANPLTYLGPLTPPVLAIHGTNDCTVSNGQSTRLIAALTAAGRCGVKRDALKAQHGGEDWLSASAQNALADFFDVVLKAP